jgi:restriction endonuclease Mrr
LLPLLRVLEDGAEHNVEEIRQRITNQFDVTASELAQKNKSGSSVLVNRVAWALAHLNMAAGPLGHTTAISLVRRGVYRITEHGVAILKRNPSELTIHRLVTEATSDDTDTRS